MQKIIRAYEQYCWVVKHNVVIEESCPNGKVCKLRCMNEKSCDETGGCRNRFISGKNKEY